MLFGLLGLCLLAALIVWARHGGKDEKKDGRNQPVPVVVSPVSMQDVPIYLRGIGTVQSPQSVVVRSRIEGELMAVHFAEGQEVKRGQLLAEIDPRPLAAQLAQARAQRDASEADLSTAKLDMGRYQNLLKEDAIAKQTVDQQVAKVAQLQATVAAASATIQAASVQLGYTRIASPLSGRVGIRRVDPGNIVSASDANGILTVTQMDPVFVQFALPQEQLPQLLRLPANAKAPVEAWTKEGGEKLGVGALEVIDNAVDAATGTIRVKAMFPNPARRLWPGQFVSTRLQAEMLRGVMVVPAAALMRGREGNYVYRLKEDQAEAADVTIGYQDETIAVVENGLALGDQVVVDGQVRLKPDSKVTLRTAEGEAADAPKDAKQP